MALGRADGQGDLFDDGLRFCEESLPENSIYRFLAWERERLFPDELFCDLFSDRRRSVPPSVVATVMVLQRLEGLSDRDAVDRYAFDVRDAAGVGGRGGAGVTGSRTPCWWTCASGCTSGRPDRIFEVGLQAGRRPGYSGGAGC